MLRKAQTKEERLAAALRANLKRRKAAARTPAQPERATATQTPPERPIPAHKPD